MKRTAEFKTSKGAEVVVTAELKLTEIIYADGDNVTVDCCEMMPVKAIIDGFPDQAGYRNFHKPQKVNGFTALAAIGRLALSAKNAAKVEKIISEIEKHPKWIEKQEKIRKNQEEIAEMESRRIANGYCPKCGSYCYGDCEAN